MARIVKVELEADTSRYRRDIDAAAASTGRFDAAVKSAGKDADVMGVEVKSAGRQVDAMGRQADTAAKGARGLGDEVDKAKGKTTGLGEEFRKSSEKVKDLDGRLRDAKATVRELSEEFLKSGRSADAFTKLSKAGKDVQELERLKTAVEQFAVDAEKMGMKAGQAAESGLASAFQSMPPQAQAAIIAGIVGAIAVGAPVIGAAVSSAVLLGVGGGALAAGIALAAKDPAVQAAWSNLGNDVKAQLVQAGAVFAPSLIRAADTFGSTMGRIMPSIRADFASLAPLVDRLAAGAGGMVERMMPGLDRLIVAAGPFINELAAHLPLIGAAIGSFFNSIAGGAPGAKAFFGDFLHWAEVGIVLLGYLINGLSQVYAALSGVSKIMSGDLSGAATIWEQFLKGKSSSEDLKKGIAGLKDGAPVLDGLASAASQAALSVDALNTAVDKMLTAQLTGKSTHLAFNQSILDMKTSVEQNGLALDDHTEKGIANSQALLRMAQAAEADRQSVLQQTGDVGKATVVFDDHMNQVYATAAALGLNKEQVDLLIGSIKNVPHDTAANIALKNAGKTQDDIREITRGLTDLNGKVANAYVITHYRTDGTPIAGVGRAQADFAMGGIRHAAVGMVIPASDPGTVLTGEPQTGGEVLIPMRGIDTSRAAMLGKAALGNYGLDVVPRPAPGYAAFANTRPMGGGGSTYAPQINLTVNAGMGTNGYQVGQQIVDHLRSFVAGNGNNVQMAIVGRQVP